MIRKVGAGILYGLALYVCSFALLLVFIMSYLFVTSGETLLVTVCVMLFISVGAGVYFEIKGGDDRSDSENTTQD